MPTNEERHEVARKLREKNIERNTHGYFEVQDLNFQAYNYLKDLEACVPDGDSLFTILADLIDPEPERTCHARIPSEMEGYVFCSKCEGLLGEYGYPNYCPYCGAKVVNDDNQ